MWICNQHGWTSTCEHSPLQIAHIVNLKHFREWNPVDSNSFRNPEACEIPVIIVANIGLSENRIPKTTLVYNFIEFCLIMNMPLDLEGTPHFQTHPYPMISPAVHLHDSWFSYMIFNYISLVMQFVVGGKICWWDGDIQFWWLNHYLLLFAPNLFAILRGYLLPQVPHHPICEKRPHRVLFLSGGMLHLGEGECVRIHTYIYMCIHINM